MGKNDADVPVIFMLTTSPLTVIIMKNKRLGGLSEVNNYAVGTAITLQTDYACDGCDR